MLPTKRRGILEQILAAESEVVRKTPLLGCGFFELLGASG